MNRLALWVLALAASLGLHLGVGIALPVILAPEPIADQPRPTSQVQIETQEVARSDAAPVPPESEAARSEAASGAELAQAAIAQSRATPLPPVAEIAQPAPTEVPVTAALPPPAAPLSARAAPVTQTVATPLPAAQLTASPPPAAPLSATTADATAVAASEAPATELAVSTAPAPMLLASAAPVATLAATAPSSPALAASAAPVTELTPEATPAVALAAAAPASPALAPSAAPAIPLPDSAAALTSAAPAIPPPSERFTAELAFSGGAGAQIDAASLATIQSFMRPGDAQAQSDQVRDAMQTLLEGVPCSRLQAAFNPDTGTLELRGHVPEEGLRGPVLAALQAQVGTGITVTDSMLILPRPQCGALAGIGAVGLPQSTDQLTNPLLVGADAHARAYDYTQGDAMVLDLAAPDYDAYIYVDFFDAAGNVLHLVPNDTVPLTLHPAQSAMRIGAGDAGTPYLNITIGPPYGQEIAAAFAASAPLYDGLRPISEPAEPYLEWMAQQVAAARAADPAFKGEWVYFFVSTAEQ